MISENAKLLEKDLCARIPYNVIILDIAAKKQGIMYTYCSVSGVEYNCEETDEWLHQTVCNVKPYLRPMSSMTEEEEDEFKQVLELELKHLESEDSGHTIIGAAASAFEIDFYNKHHFDYRGLIPMGLALEAPKDMYKTK